MSIHVDPDEWATWMIHHRPALPSAPSRTPSIIPLWGGEQLPELADWGLNNPWPDLLRAEEQGIFTCAGAGDPPSFWIVLQPCPQVAIWASPWETDGDLRLVWLIDRRSTKPQIFHGVQWCHALHRGTLTALVADSCGPLLQTTESPLPLTTSLTQASHSDWPRQHT